MKRALQQELFPAPPPGRRVARVKTRERQIVTWNCGCSRAFRARGFGRHRRACMFSLLAWPLVVIPAEVPRVS